MRVLQSQDFIDFSNATLHEKIDLVYELLDKQRELARLTLANGNFSSEVETLLKFIIVICNTNFAVMLLHSIENKIYTAPEFFFFIRENLTNILKRTWRLIFWSISFILLVFFSFIQKTICLLKKVNEDNVFLCLLELKEWKNLLVFWKNVSKVVCLSLTF